METLNRCASTAWNSAECDKIRHYQLSAPPPYFDCDHLTRLMMGMTPFFEALWRRHVPSEKFMMFDVANLSTPEFWPTLLRFLDLDESHVPPRDQASLSCGWFKSSTPTFDVATASCNLCYEHV